MNRDHDLVDIREKEHKMRYRASDIANILENAPDGFSYTSEACDIIAQYYGNHPPLEGDHLRADDLRWEWYEYLVDDYGSPDPVRQMENDIIGRWRRIDEREPYINRQDDDAIDQFEELLINRGGVFRRTTYGILIKVNIEDVERIWEHERQDEEYIRECEEQEAFWNDIRECEEREAFWNGEEGYYDSLW